jgi:predicted porin
MKQALIALAVLGAASGAAVAQSSVTLYGVADVGIGKAGGKGEKKWGAESGAIVNNTDSRIGFTGTEDLGSGLWAGFRFEGAVNLASGDFAAGFAREAHVLLGSKSWGTVKLGRSLTPSFQGVSVWELTGQAKYSVVNNTYGWGAFPYNRTNAQLDYKTPSINGLSAEVAWVPAANGGLLDGGYGQTSRTSRWDMNVAYVQGPVSIALTANKASNTNPASGPNADRPNYSVGGQYRIGERFALAASYNRANHAQNFAGGANGARVFGKRFGFSLGGRFVSGPLTITLDLTRDTRNEVNTANRKYTNGLLEGKYALSKRTFLYADYSRLDGAHNYGLGIRHNF